MKKRVLIALVVALALALGLTASVSATPPIPLTKTVYIDGTWGTDTPLCGQGPDTWACKTITYAVDDIAIAGDTINVAAGTYDAVLGEVFPITITQDGLTLKSADGAATTIIDGGNAPALMKVNASDVTIGGSGFTFKNPTAAAPTGFDIDYGIAAGCWGNASGLVVQDNIFQIVGNGITLCSGAASTSGNHAVIQNNDFEAGWDAVRTSSMPGISNVTYVDLLNNDVALLAGCTGCMGFVLEGAEHVVVDGNNFTGTDASIYVANQLTNVSDFQITNNDFQTASPGRGIDICSGTGACGPIGGPNSVSDVNIEGNTLNGGTYGVRLRKGAGDGTISNIAVHFNNITNHTTFGIDNEFTTVLDAENNWWGANDGPSGVGPGTGDAVSANVDYDPWLVLKISRQPRRIVADGSSTSTITGDMTKNSDGADTSALGHIPDGTEVTFTTNLGSLGSSQVVKPTTNGIATATLTASDTAGKAIVRAKVDSQRVRTRVWMVPQRPALRSPDDGAKIGRRIVRLRWYGVPGAVVYRVQLWRAGDRANKIVNEITTDLKYTTPALRRGRRYRWRVRAGLDLGANRGPWGPWSEIRRFRIPRR